MLVRDCSRKLEVGSCIEDIEDGGCMGLVISCLEEMGDVPSLPGV